MNILIETQAAFYEHLSVLKYREYASIDTETYGVEYKDLPFSVQMADQENCFFIDFRRSPDLIPEMTKFLPTLNLTWFIHNAKFDLMMLRKIGVELNGKVHCTQAIERLLYNCHMHYSLDACLKRRGRAKHDGVKEWIRKNKAFTWKTEIGKKKRTKLLHFDRVPFDLMFEYGCQDVADTYFLGIDQLTKLDKSLEGLYENECKLTKVFFEMESIGIKIDAEYTQKGFLYEEKKKEEAVSQLEKHVGRSYESGPIWLKSELDNRGIKYTLDAETCNPIFDKAALNKIEDPICDLIIKIRNHEKYAGTYYGSFLSKKDSNDLIHANIRQDGTDTGRVSYWEPNLQNVPKEDKGTFDFYVRKCFVPRSDFFLAMLDYDQMEYRVLADYAKETEWIDKIMEGIDVHQATADMMGIDRKTAKTINFMLLYGGGAKKLAATLGIPEAEGYNLRKLYFAKLPKIQKFMEIVQDRVKARGYIYNRFGRQYHYEGVVRLKDGRVFDPSYKFTNYLIQGTCADVMRHAMVDVHYYLADKRSRMLVTVHDELILEIHKNELEVVKKIKEIMENSYPAFTNIKLTVGIEHSKLSWGRCDIADGLPECL